MACCGQEPKKSENNNEDIPKDAQKSIGRNILVWAVVIALILGLLVMII